MCRSTAFSLTRYQGGVHPVIRAHPFALAHMYVSGQLSPQAVVEIGAATGPDTFQLTTSLDQPCALSEMLGRANVGLSLCPRFDLSVR